MGEGKRKPTGFWPHLLWALVSFTLWSLAFHPADAWPLAWIALVPWMAFHRAAPRRGTKRAFLLAYYGHFTAVLWWVGEIAVVGAFLVPLLGLPFAWLAAWAVDRGVHRQRLSPLLVYPLAFVATELLRDRALGLTWSSIGYTQWRWLELLQISSVVRVHGVSFAVLLGNVALSGVLLASRGRLGWRIAGRECAVAAVVLAGLHGFGAWRMATLETEDGPRVVGIQPNVPQLLRVRGAEAEAYVRSFKVVRSTLENDLDPDLLVFPETFGPVTREPRRTLPDVLSRRLAPELPHTWGSLFPRGRGQVTVFGYGRKRLIEPGETIADEDGKGDQEWNVAAVVRNGGELLGQYAKRELVPFGEFIPYPQGWPGRDALKQRILETGGFIPDLTRGTEAVVVPMGDVAPGVAFGLTICFEMVYPDYFRETTSLGADFLVNVSNDGWYGDSEELDLVHVATRFRAIECGRTLVRVSNTGISTLVDPVGRYLDTAGTPSRRKEVAGFIHGVVPLTNGTTPWVRFGDWLPFGFVMALAAALLVGEVRRRRVT